MKDLNKIILIGRLGNDPVKRETKNGTAVTHFSLATSRMVPDSSAAAEAGRARDTFGEEGASREETVWHNIVVWGRQAEICAQYLRKGRTVYVEGAMRKRNYSDKEGNPRISIEVHADSVGFLGGVGGEKRAAEDADSGVAAAAS